MNEEWTLYERMTGPLLSDEEDPDGPECEHVAYSFFDAGEKYCVDCYQPLDEEDE